MWASSHIHNSMNNGNNNNADSISISRATSVSRRSRAGSTVSRNQSLIRKSISAPHDLKPSDVLIERFVAWKAIVKQLIAYFEGIADIENNTAKELTKLGAVIQVPFRSGNQFLGEDGMQVGVFCLCKRTELYIHIALYIGYILRYSRQNEDHC
jgi:hypothetical protein